MQTKLTHFALTVTLALAHAYGQGRARRWLLVDQCLQRRGFFEADPQNVYSVNNVTAKRNSDGSVTVHFDGEPSQPNYLGITPGWNYIVRLYCPRTEILNGVWKFPEAQPVP